MREMQVQELVICWMPPTTAIHLHMKSMLLDYEFTSYNGHPELSRASWVVIMARKERC